MLATEIQMAEVLSRKPEPPQPKEKKRESEHPDADLVVQRTQYNDIVHLTPLSAEACKAMANGLNYGYFTVSTMYQVEVESAAYIVMKCDERDLVVEGMSVNEALNIIPNNTSF